MLVMILSWVVGGFMRSRSWSWRRVIVTVVGANILAPVFLLFLSHARF